VSRFDEEAARLRAEHRRLLDEEEAKRRREVAGAVGDEEVAREVARLYQEYLRPLKEEEAKHRREVAGVVGYIALFAIAIAVTITLSTAWPHSSPKGGATPLPTPTATAPAPTVTIAQPQVTVTELIPAQNSGPDWIPVLAGIGTLLTGVAAVLALRRSREKASKKKADPNCTGLRVYDALADGQKTTAQLHALLGLQPANLRMALGSLVALGLVRQHGGQGQATRYQRTDSSKLASGPRTTLWHGRAWVVFHGVNNLESAAHRTIEAMTRP
jgi:DNA-binding transcriptional ArsR family regulator